MARSEESVWLIVKNRLRVIFVCSLLEFGALSGVPMRPEQIQELMRTMNQPKLAHVIPNENENEDPARGRGRSQ